MTRTVAAQPADAFDVVANVAEWPEIIGSVSSVEVLTPGPIRAGTRVRATRVIFGAEATHELEVATLDRPHRLRLVADNADLSYELDHLIDAVFGSGGGCRIVLVLRTRPTRPIGELVQPFVQPRIEMAVRDELERDVSDLADAVKAFAGP